MGLLDGRVRLFSIPENAYLSTIDDFEGKGAVVGLHCDENKVFVGRKSGHISLRNEDASDVIDMKLDEKGTLDKIVYDTSYDNIIATGGEFNAFKLWDVNTKKCTFQAKSVSNKFMTYYFCIQTSHQLFDE